MESVKKEPADLLEVRDLTISFSRYRKGFERTELEVVRGLDVRVGAGEMVAVAGSSGSGKSLLAHALLGLLPANARVSGDIRFRGRRLDQRRLEELRGREIALVPQSVTFLDPLEKVGAQVRLERKDPESFRRQRELFDFYGLPQAAADLYPFELSGGMARRVLLASARMDSPSLIVADEPTPGLHLEAAKKALAFFRDFADRGGGVLLITHDLELALETADRIAVFYAGATVEEAPAADFRREELLRHPYSRALWRALPRNGFQPTAGAQPCPGELPPGCAFGPRCGLFSPECSGPVAARALRGGLVRCVKAA